MFQLFFGLIVNNCLQSLIGLGLPKVLNSLRLAGMKLILKSARDKTLSRISVVTISLCIQVVDKVKMQMDSFLEDGSHEATITVIRALSVAIPLTTSNLRDYILLQLSRTIFSTLRSASNMGYL